MLQQRNVKKGKRPPRRPKRNNFNTIENSGKRNLNHHILTEKWGGKALSPAPAREGCFIFLSQVIKGMKTLSEKEERRGDLLNP